VVGRFRVPGRRKLDDALAHVAPARTSDVDVSVHPADGAGAAPLAGTEIPLMVEQKSARKFINANRAQLFGTDPERLIAFICECGDDGCAASVLLTAPEYAGRTAGGKLLLHAQHSPTG
jgi:hypothetical protein